MHKPKHLVSKDEATRHTRRNGVGVQQLIQRGDLKVQAYRGRPMVTRRSLVAYLRRRFETSLRKLAA